MEFVFTNNDLNGLSIEPRLNSLPLDGIILPLITTFPFNDKSPSLVTVPENVGLDSGAYIFSM